MSQQHEMESMTAEEKRALLAQLLDGSAEATPSNLSVEQRRLWVLLQLDSSKPWQIVSAVRLTGRIDPAAMQQALTAVVQRHEVLRTTFREVDGHPLATTVPAVTLRLPVVAVAADDLEAELAGVVATETRTRFDLAKGPLVRASLLRAAPEDHVLLLTLHQLVADRRSTRLVTDELLTHYAALMAGSPVEAAAPVDFHALVTAQRDWVNSDDAAKDIAYWRDQLAALTPLELPTDRPRPPMKTIHGAAVVVDLDREHTGDLAGYAERSGSALPELLLAVYTAVLSRYAQQRDLAVGITVPPAWRPDGAELVGPLENHLPLRIEQADGDSLTRATERVRTVLAEAMAHARLSFDRIVNAAQPHRDLRHTPLFQSFFAFEDEPASRPLPGATATPLDLPVTWTPHDIDLYAIRRDGALRLRVQYNTDLFDRGTVERMAGHIVLLLRTALAEPDRPLAAIPLVTDRERSQVLSEWNDTGAEHDRTRTLHQLVEDAARATPDAVAVVAGDVELTYAQLDARADALAADLAARGVGPDSRVGVLVDRSPHSVVGLLGVLKAGGAYVPLDPAYPAERLAFILGDADARIVAGRAGALAALPADAVDVVDADRVEVPEADPARPATRSAAAAGPGDLAYVIYTSGSTGRPKGVAVEHRQIVHATAARSACEGPGRPERYLVLAPLTFDASGGGLYWTLSQGGTVLFPTDADVLDPRLLGRFIRGRRVTHVDGVPSQYAVLLETDLEPHESVRTTILAGEALPPSLVADHFRRSPEAALFNEYGPTETTVWATVHAVSPSDAEQARVPIGRPIPNSRVHLLDKLLNPVPPGVPGELYIGGEGVSRGYVNRPAMTAERFLPDPYSGRPGARLYRTGDLARYRADGAIEFLGRADTQVKIRGFRVELAEIESVILRHPVVAEAVVTVREDQPGVPRLIAYVVPVIGRVLTQETLLNHVLGQLPDYMAPSQFVTLERMPLTRHGKIDLAALPAPQDLVEGGFVEPSTPLEARIAGTFAAVLGLRQISATADFFSLGGNSLLVARLAAELSREHDVELPIDEIFRVPTVEGIAHAVETHQMRRDNVDSAALYAQQLAELVADVRLDPDIRPDGLPKANWFAPRNVLVTGATGYLGAFLAVELVNRTDATVHCLVRGESQDAAWDRLEETLRKYKSWDESYRARLKVVVGDLAKPRLGLSEEMFDRYAGLLDSIYHSGAIVNFTYPYEAMKAANVLGTEELLRLATRTTLKAFHLVSSVDVFMGTGAERPFTEEDLSDNPVKVPTGYPRTKWVAEKIVLIARDRGVPVTVQRPWMITGHTKTGASHDTDYLYVYLKGFLDLGVLPLYNDVINAVPVDYTAAAIVYTSLREGNLGKNFNITNREPTTMQQCYQWLRSFGYDLNVVDEEEARRKALAVDEDHVLYPLTPILRVASMRHAALDPELQKQVDPLDECRVLTAALEGSGIECPPVNEQWAHSCFRFLIERGYLPAPEDVAATTSRA